MEYAHKTPGVAQRLADHSYATLLEPWFPLPGDI
jgi:hypothetical protein